MPTERGREANLSELTDPPSRSLRRGRLGSLSLARLKGCCSTASPGLFQHRRSAPSKSRTNPPKVNSGEPATEVTELLISPAIPYPAITPFFAVFREG